MHRANDIARHLVRGFIDRGKPTTNLKLQHQLYLAWREYFQRFGEPLFEDSFEAWRIGPVVPSVYREYRVFANVGIISSDLPEGRIGRRTTAFLDGFVSEHLDDTVQGLIDEVMAEGEPWAECYRKGRKAEIPFRLIRGSARTRSADLDIPPIRSVSRCPLPTTPSTSHASSSKVPERWATP